MRMTGHFVEGEPHGLWISTTNDEPFEVHAWKSGRPHGVWKAWHDDEVFHEAEFVEGVLVRGRWPTGSELRAPYGLRHLDRDARVSTKRARIPIDDCPHIGGMAP